MKLTKKTKELIDNLPIHSISFDFRTQTLNLMIFLFFLGGGIFLQLYFHPDTAVMDMLLTTSGAIIVFMITAGFRLWIATLILVTASWISSIYHFDTRFMPFLAVVTAGFLLAPMIQLAQQWEKAIILRLGKFSRIKGPGVFFILPVIEKVTEFVDTRIRATDFSAETTLTHDTVPVNVDAIAFWMIWDPKKAILELEAFLDAVILSAQTALRDAIGKHELATLLSERDKLGKEIQEILEAKTSAWGITILSVEIRDIIIPKNLEDAMSRRAQAERERQARVILGTAEVEISEKFADAAERYKDNPTALHLRAMNMIYEGLRKNGTIVLLPSSAIETMSLGTVMGANQAMEQLKKNMPEAAGENPESGEE